jgi:hypothetical protein
MAENNGKWTFWLVGFLATALLGGLMTLTTHVIANDKESRARDTQICKETEEKNAQIYSVLYDIRVQLAEIKTDTSYLKKAVK